MLAPEHPLVEQFAAASPDPAAFRAKAQAFRSQERDVRMGGKQGFDTGRQAINPFTGKPVPIWVANFVLWGIWHRRGDGRARPRRARLRVRQEPTTCRSPSSSSARASRSRPRR